MAERITKKGGGAPIEQWVPWRIHRRHPKVLRIAAMTGADPDHVLASVCDWFRWVDSSCDSERTGVTPSMVDAIAGFRGKRGGKSLAAAFADSEVGWVRTDGDGTLLVVDFDRWFGQSARRRLVDARRKWMDRNGGQTADAGADTLRTPCGRQSGRGVEQEIEKELEPVQSLGEARNSPLPEGPIRAASHLGWAGPDRAPEAEDDPETQGSCVAVLRRLEALGVGEPSLGLIVAARRFTPADIDSAWEGVRADPGVKHPVRALVSRLKQRAGIGKSIDRLSETDQAWVREIQALRRELPDARRRA